VVDFLHLILPNCVTADIGAIRPIVAVSRNLPGRTGKHRKNSGWCAAKPSQALRAQWLGAARLF
jgi:hypothetical protein